MQIIAHPKGLYRLSYWADKVTRLTDEAQARLKALGDWERCKAHGMSDQETAQLVGHSRTTYFRRKRVLACYGPSGLERRSRRPKRHRVSQISVSTQRLILKLRRANPTYGKLKIAHLLKRDHGITLSDSSVGRLLKTFMDQGKIVKYRAVRRVKKPRRFTGHAQPYSQRKRSTRVPGEMIQVDHMTVTKNQRTFKAFHAWDPASKWLVTFVTSNATARAAARFLAKLLRELPFPVRSIQVDGGSEFRADFEAACKAKAIPLFVLPPASPKLNGGVERSNRTFREDFYDPPRLANTLDEWQGELYHATKKYNTYRPHRALNLMTPLEYTQHYFGERLQSHML